MTEDSGYRRLSWTLGGKIGCAVWPVAAFVLIDPMMDWILGPCFFEEGCGRFEGVGLSAALAAAMVAAALVSFTVRLAVSLLFRRTTT